MPWAPLLAAPLDVEVEPTPEVEDLDPSFWRARLHGVMGTLLGHLLDSPTLLVFDDVHWMDDASSELLRYLGTQLPTRPWLACTTRRPGEDGFAAADGHAAAAGADAAARAASRGGCESARASRQPGDRRLTEEEVAALMERAAGNPLFLRELASVGEKTEDAEDLPDTVETLVATRIDQLAPGDRALLRWASVLGVSFSGSLILDVLEDDPIVAAASEAWDRLGEFVERDPDVPARSASATRSSVTLHTRGSRTSGGASCTGASPRSSSTATQSGPKDRAELLSLHYFNAGALAGDLAVLTHGGPTGRGRPRECRGGGLPRASARGGSSHRRAPRRPPRGAPATSATPDSCSVSTSGASAAYGIARKYVDPG